MKNSLTGIDYAKINIGKPIKEFTLDSIKFSHLVNTHYFCEAANDYLRNEKAGYPVYTREPVGSNRFWEYWIEQERRCMEGFQVGDLYITGRQYFFLNFFRIMRSPQMTEKERNQVSGQQDKIEAFPSFWAIQQLWFTFTHVARYGGSFLGVSSGKGGLDICAVKTRGAGFSFMDACDDTYNYNFIDKSKSYILAAESKYLEGVDGIMPKIQTALDFLNTGTRGINENGTYSAGVWKKNRYDTGDEPMLFKAGYKDLSTNAILGSGSVIGAIICDTVRKARGARGMKITFEEGGSFNKLEEIIINTKALVSDGSIKTGSRSLFGTGGESGPGIEGLEKIFNNPRPYGFMQFPDIWSGEMDTVGFFCPSFMADAGNIDENGNSNITAHLKVQNEIREDLKTVSPATYDMHIAEYPFVPGEALKRLQGNIMPNVEHVIKRIETTKVLGLIHGVLDYADNGRVDFIPAPNARPIIEYPHDQSKNLDGAVTIKQQAYIGENGKVPDNMYFIVVDNYAIDDTDNLTSLFSAYVYKFFNKYDVSYHRLPIAWYNARPLKQHIAFDNLMKLSIMYNAKIMGEYNAPGQLLINYFTERNKAHMLMDEPDKSGVEIQSRRKHKFMSITGDSKLGNLRNFVEWLLEERYTTEEGQVVRNMDELDDLGLLYEVKKFSLKKGKNFDRISACSLAPIILQQQTNHIVQQMQQESSFLTTTKLFADLHGNKNKRMSRNASISEY